MDSTFADLQQRLGGIPLDRIHLYPWPGLAAEKDVLEIHARTGRLCELVDGILVEKPMGFYESAIAFAIGRSIGNYLDAHNLGIVAGVDGMLRILGNRIRIPDVSFVRWERMPQSDAPVPAVSPDLAVEVISKGNTELEMQSKLAEYFAGGTQLVWIIEPATRSAQIYRSPEESHQIDKDGSLLGDDVLPGFELKLSELFAQVERPESR